jgi:hypothetical protein
MISITIPQRFLDAVRRFFSRQNGEFIIWRIALLSAAFATGYLYVRDEIVTYGDAESHLNIAKRVIDSITPGAAQLGGIWLPLPHILLMPFVYFDTLWQTGLAGSIVSGVAYIVTAIVINRLIMLLTGQRMAAVFGVFVFLWNPNMLYLQGTPMTELPLIVFFALSSYLLVRFLHEERLVYLIGAAFFGFCAALSRYDGWFLIGVEAMVLAARYLPWERVPRSVSEIRTLFRRDRWEKMEGMLILFGTLAFFAVALWLLWDYLILGDPFYFTTSEFSARSQQIGWHAKGELPAYHNIWLAFLYYFTTSMANVGILLFFAALVGFVWFLANRAERYRFLIGGLLASSFVFYVLTLFMGQSIIFIPHITPPTFEWTLFNVRYGVMMVPFAAIFIGYLFSRLGTAGRFVLVVLFVAQLAFYGVGYAKVVSYDDGVWGLSSAKRPDAERFLAREYDGGLLLLDDYSRLISIVRSGVPMRNVIYVGNRPYWEESLREPEKYARWIVVQQNDEIWDKIYTPPEQQGRLYKYFTKIYTSPEILIFKRNETAP